MAERMQGRSFVVYYGRGPMDAIEEFDIAILEPAGWSTPLLRELKSKHVTCLAYVSGLEIPSWKADEVDLRDEDYLVVGGKRWVKEPFGNWIALPESLRWRTYLENHFKRLSRQGWDGFFIDTLGDVEDEQLAGQSGWLVPGVADLVRMMRLWIGDRGLIVNNGLWQVVPMIAPYIDGVCWEGHLTTQVLQEPWCLAVIEYLGKMRAEHRWTNLMLTQNAGETLGQKQELLHFVDDATRYGFLPYAAPFNYAEAIRTRGGRIISAPRN